MMQPLAGVLSPLGVGRRVAAAADWWAVAGQTCVAAYKAIGAASLATSYVNLATPGTNNAAPGVAPTLAAGGWAFVAASGQYLTTDIAPVAGTSMLVRFSARSGGTYLIGATQAGAFFTLYDVGTARGGELGGSYRDTAAAGSILAICAGNLYLDGVSLGAALTGSYPTVGLFIGARNDNGTARNHVSSTIAAIAIYSTTLSADDNMALKIRMAALA